MILNREVPNSEYRIYQAYGSAMAVILTLGIVGNVLSVLVLLKVRMILIYIPLYSAYVWVKSKGAHAPPPGWPPGIWHLLFFLAKFPTMRALSLVKCPPPKGFFRDQIPCPPGWSDKTQIDFRKPEWGFQHCHFYYFCIPVQRLRSSFFLLCT